MGYFEGEVKGYLEFLELLKEKLLGAGWELKEESESRFDRLPSDLFEAVSDVDATSYRRWFRAQGGPRHFTLILPLALRPKRLTFEGREGGVKIYGIDALENATLLGNPKVGDFEVEVGGASAYSKYRFEANSDYAQSLNIHFEEPPLRSRFLSFYSRGISGASHIHLNFRTIIGFEGARNIELGGAQGYAANVGFLGQPQRGSVTLSLHEGKIGYFLSVNKNRLLGAVKIHVDDDPKEKNPLYQIFYAGFLNPYGGALHFPSPYALCAGGEEPLRRWSEVDTMLPDSPLVFVPRPSWVRAKSNGSGWNLENMPLSPDPNGKLFTTPLSLYEHHTPYNGGHSANLIGEYDGLIKVLASASSRSGDIIEAEGARYRLIQNGKKTTLVDFFGIKME